MNGGEIVFGNANEWDVALVVGFSFGYGEIYHFIWRECEYKAVNVMFNSIIVWALRGRLAAGRFQGS